MVQADGFLFALGLVPTAMFALGMIAVLEHYGALKAARKMLTPAAPSSDGYSWFYRSGYYRQPAVHRRWPLGPDQISGGMKAN